MGTILGCRGLVAKGQGARGGFGTGAGSRVEANASTGTEPRNEVVLSVPGGYKGCAEFSFPVGTKPECRGIP